MVTKMKELLLIAHTGTPCADLVDLLQSIAQFPHRALYLEQVPIKTLIENNVTVDGDFEDEDQEAFLFSQIVETA